MCLGSRPGCWATVIYIILVNSHMLLKLVINGTLKTRRRSLALSLPLVSLSSFISSVFHNSDSENGKEQAAKRMENIEPLRTAGRRSISSRSYNRLPWGINAWTRRGSQNSSVDRARLRTQLQPGSVVRVMPPGRAKSPAEDVCCLLSLSLLAAH